MKQKKSSSVKMRLTCAIIFILYTYLYLSSFEADVLAVAQHVLSGGQTSYNYILAPIICTLVLYLMQIGVYAITRIGGRFHALTYFPSFLILTVLTDVPVDVRQLSLGAWWVIVPLVLLLWAGAVYMAKRLELYEQEPRHDRWFSRSMWINMAQLAGMVMIMLLFVNTNRLFHQRMRMENLMIQGKYEDALLVGKRSLQTDSSLTMLRIACLHRTGGMGEKLFTYPLVGGGKAMLPNGTSVEALRWKMMRFKNNRMPIDYKLCGLLLDKDLDRFVVELPKYYDSLQVSLPRHYREALTLYTHRRGTPILVFHDNVMDTDYQDYQALAHKFANPMERQTNLRDAYGKTYWYYYDYGNK